MSRYDDILEDVARKAITDPKTIGDIFDCNPEEFSQRVATMATPPLYMAGMSPAGEAHLLRSEFTGWLVDRAKELHYIQQAAQQELNADSFYGSEESLPCGWREQRTAA